MAVVATTTYLYVDQNLTSYYVQGSELIDRGPWSSTAFYVVNDVIQIGIDQYVALQANSNVPPSSIIDENWSTLVIVEEAGSIVSAGSDYYARYLAEQALQVAYSGTALGSNAYILATAGSNLAWDAYTLAQIGTVIPPLSTLPDVYIPAPADGQVLVYSGSGSVWTAGSLTADVIFYGRNSLTTVGDALDSLFYVSPVVTSFSNNIGVVETGGSVSVVSLTWAYNKSIVSQSINQGIGSLNPALRTFVVSGAYTSTTTFALTASDGTNNCNGNTSVSFMQKRYWGNSSQTSLNDAEVIALTSEFSSSRAQSRTLSPSGQYIYFAYPASFGAATFTVNGLLNTDWVLVTRSFVNASGYSESYRIYRSTNLLTGTYVIVVS